MKRLEPNALLAATTVIALMFVVACASLVAPPERVLKYVALAFVAPLAFIALNAFMLKRRNRRPRVLIDPQAPGTAIWAGLFPGMVMASAVLPLLAPRADFGLMILIAGIYTGVTIESALQARRAAA